MTLDREFILQTMLHEVSHILLRYNPVLKNKLFSIIGFEKITTGKSDNFNNRKNLITNPDAVGYTYFWRVPKQFNLADTAVNFYLYCDTSEIKKNKSAEYFEILKTGILNKNFQDIPNFDLRAVHTYFGIDYLLQPDEIIAVYFSSFIYGCKNPEILKDTSPFVAQIGKMVCNF